MAFNIFYIVLYNITHILALIIILNTKTIIKKDTMLILDIANGWKTAIMVVAMIAVFYFFMIKPQSDKTKAENAYRDGLKAGDRIMTAGGIHVTFVSRSGAMAVVEAAEGVRMKVQIATLQPIPERKSKK